MVGSTSVWGSCVRMLPVTFRVTVIPDGAGDGEPTALFEERYAGKEAWGQRSVDLGDFAGQTVTLGLEADSEDGGRVALWGAPTVTGSGQSPLPNVIFYVFDGGAADYMSVYGYNRRTTPTLERFPSLPNVRETRSMQRIRVGRRQRKRTCWDCEREWKRMVVPLEPGRPSEARQLLADPEVVDRPLRRRFSPSYKLRIVEEADRCTEPGEVGQVLRREGLYSSHLTTWRKAAHSGSLKALSKKRGRKPERNPLDEKVRKLERRNARLENELRKAHLIIDVQGKVAGLLGISLDDGTNS